MPVIYINICCRNTRLHNIVVCFIIKAPWPMTFGSPSGFICSLAHCQHFLRKSLKSVHNWVMFFTNRQIKAVFHINALVEVIGVECVFTYTQATKGRTLIPSYAQSQARLYATPCAYTTSVNIWKSIQTPFSSRQRMKWPFFSAIMSLPWWHLVYQELSMRVCRSTSLPH